MRRRAHLHKTVGFIITVFLLILSTSISYAIDFPEWKDGTIQDESNRLSIESIEAVNLELEQLPYPAKVFVFENLEETITEYASQAFEYYELSSEELLVVYVIESGLITAVAGADLEKTGITSDKLREYMTEYFKPLALEGDYVGGFQHFLTQLYANVEAPTANDVPADTPIDSSDSKEQGSSTPSDTTTKEKEDSKGLSLWVYILIALVAGIINTFLVIYLRKRQLYLWAIDLEDKKDALIEEWSQVDVNFDLKTMQEEVMLRISNLESTYEDYHYRIFPELKEDFNDAFLYLSRFRIVAAKEVLNYIEKTLEDAEYLLKQLKSEQKQIVEIKTETPKSIDHIKGILHRIHLRMEKVATQYGISLSFLKEVIANKEKQYKQLQRAIEQNENVELVDIQQLTLELQNIDLDLDHIDQMSQEIEESIPNRLKELENKLKGVEFEDSSQLMDILKEAREKWNSLIVLWDEGKVSQLVNEIQSINESLTNGEAMIQQEFDQNQAVMKTISHYEKRMKEILDIYEQDHIQFEKLYRKYQLEEDPIVDQVKRIEETVKTLDSSYRTLLQKMENRSFKEAFQISDPLPEQLEQFADLISQFHMRVEALSTEEERYSGEIKSLRNRLRMVRQQLDRSLLPGKQDQILELIDQGFKALLETEVLFDQIPLRLNKISQQLDIAHEQVVVVEQLTNTMIENAKETEAIIRRLNIYRTSVPQIAQLLMMAENCYRDQKFDEAVSYARKADDMVANNMK